MVARMDIVEAEDGYSLRAHKRIEKVVTRKSKTWPQDSQVLFVVKKPLEASTRGFNHWSTWYLRKLTGRRDLIGLVGQEHSISRDPFVEEYSDGDSEYWEIIDGRSKQIKMIGLEPDRPLFVYTIARDHRRSAAATVVFENQGRARMVPPGVAPETGAVVADNDPALSSAENLYVWPSAAETIVPGDEKCDFEAEFAPDASEMLTVNVVRASPAGIDLPVVPDGCVNVVLRFEPDTIVEAPQPFSKEEPPMPTQGPVLTMYQRPFGLLLTGLKYDREARSPFTGKNQATTFEFAVGNGLGMTCGWTGGTIRSALRRYRRP